MSDESTKTNGELVNADQSKQVVSLNDVIALVNGFPALSGVSFTVESGEVVHLKGANGAGKTTLLNLCAGLLPLHSGSGQVLGYDLTQKTDRRILRRIAGLLSYQTFLYDDLTVQQNLKFWSRANKIDSDIVEPIMEKLGLNGRLKEVLVSDLSSGQRRRTSLAVIACRRPRLWLLDEPYDSLDVNGRDLVKLLIENAVSFGATVIFSSHDHHRATQMSTRTVELKGGTNKTSVSSDKSASSLNLDIEEISKNVKSKIQQENQAREKESIKSLKDDEDKELVKDQKDESKEKDKKLGNERPLKKEKKETTTSKKSKNSGRPLIKGRQLKGDRDD